MKKIIFLMIAILALGCSEKKHKVSFRVEIASTKGDKSLIVDCFESDTYKSYMKSMNDLMSGRTKDKPEEPKVIAHFSSNGKPEHELKFSMELPEKFVTCMVDKSFPIRFKNGTQEGLVFKAKADDELSFRYNMFTSNLGTIESKASSVEITE